MRRRLRTALGVLCVAAATAIVMLTTNVFGAETNSGTYTMANGSNLKVSCPSGGPLTNSNVTATSERVHCGVAATPTTTAPPSSAPPPITTSPRTTPPPATTTSPPATTRPPGAPCVMSTASGNCGPYDYPANTASNGYNTYVGPDMFNQIPGARQTLTAYDPGNWHVVANMPAGNGAVVSYPSNSQLSTGGHPDQLISAYDKITSTFAENMHSTPQTSAEAAYDVWTATGVETMIQHDISPLRPGCNDRVLATVTFNDPDGGSHDWDFCPYGSERIWEIHGPNIQSGSVDIKAMLMWEINHGYLPANSKLGLVGYGFEICSTGGVDETFEVTKYSLTALPNP